MECLSKMVGIVQRMGRFRKSGRRVLQKSSKKRREQGGTVAGTGMMNRRGFSKQEKERKKNIMKERDKLRNWDPGW